MFESKLQQKFDALWVLFQDHATELRRCFRGTDAIGIGHRGFRRPGSGRADGHHPVVPRWVQVRSDHEGQPDNEVAGSYVWQLTFAFARALKTSLSQILWFKWLTCSWTWSAYHTKMQDFSRFGLKTFPGTSITGKARFESQSLFDKLSSVTTIKVTSHLSIKESMQLISISMYHQFFLQVILRSACLSETFLMSLGLVTWCLGKSFESGCGEDGSRQGLL